MPRPSLCLRVRSILSLALLLVLTSCLPDTGPDLGKAYVAPATVNLRSQLNQKNSTAAVLKHGEIVSVLDVRRRYVKVRSTKGAEGWMDSADLLSPDDMRKLQAEQKQALALPSEGAATAYENLNVHLAPSRLSPAFAQIPEGGAVDVLAHRIAPKVMGPARSSAVFVPEHPQPVARKPKKDRTPKNAFRLPPPPAPPKPPANWQSLLGSSPPDDAERNEVSADNKPNSKKTDEPAKRVVLEDWTLVRTHDRQTGWVLSRNLMMSIPDDVAQYAGGRHITSYFDLGLVNDDAKGPKHNWLWTTTGNAQMYDFDAWRVFLWNRRRHRYETSYRQHDLEGYFPVHVDPADPKATGRTFQLIVKDDDGKFRRKHYSFDGALVHLTGTEDYNPDEKPAGAKQTEAQTLDAKRAQTNWFKRLTGNLKKRFSDGN